MRRERYRQTRVRRAERRWPIEVAIRNALVLDAKRRHSAAGVRTAVLGSKLGRTSNVETAAAVIARLDDWRAVRSDLLGIVDRLASSAVLGDPRCAAAVASVELQALAESGRRVA